jgi:hypothetical protein
MAFVPALFGHIHERKAALAMYFLMALKRTYRRNSFFGLIAA